MQQKWKIQGAYQAISLLTCCILLVFVDLGSVAATKWRHQRSPAAQYNPSSYGRTSSGLAGVPSTCQLQLECASDQDKIKLPVMRARGPPGSQGEQGPRGDPGPRGSPGRDLTSSMSRGAPRKVAFFAGLKENVNKKPPEKSKVLFDSVVTNVGDGYNQSSGIFTAPIAGVYNFLIAISAQGYKKAAVRLMHNGKHIFDVWCESAPWSTATNQAILKLMHRDQVWIQFRPENDTHNIHGFMYSTFSGYLLFEL